MNYYSKNFSVNFTMISIDRYKSHKQKLFGTLNYLFIFKFYFIFKLYIIVLVLPNIKMNPPQVQCTILDARGWCTGTTQRDGMGREEGGGFRMGNTCIPVGP